MRIGIVGGGILGIALARQLLLDVPTTEVTVLEKEPRLAAHQTGHNSGVVHAGIYYPPGSLKATLCRRGAELLRDFCRRHGVSYEECGKLVVAIAEAQLPRLDEIHRRAAANGVPGIRRLSGHELRDIEPHVVGVAGLHSPATAIVDFRAVVDALAAQARERGLKTRLGHEVVALAETSAGIGVRSRAGGEWNFDRLVLCAGVQSDRLAALAGDDRDPAIVPFRGEYYLLRPERRHLVRGLVYPVPDPRFPFLGIHLTKRHDEEILVGPNAVLALAREGYRWRDISARDVWETLRWPGFRRFAVRHWRTGATELAGSLSKRTFTAAAARYVPELRAADLVRGPSGVRAQAMARDGALVDDFRISHRGRVIAIRNAPSPAATSSLAIAEHLAKLID